MHFHIVTLFPESVRAYTDASILGRAQKDKKVKISFYNPRDFTKDLPAPRQGKYFVYVIRCSDNSFYIGQTRNVEARYELHKLGRAAQHTKKFPPLELIHYEIFDTLSEAVDREKKLKTGFGRKWLKREWMAGRTRQAGKHRRIDKRPYGGGPGMVLEAEAIVKAVEKAVGRKKHAKIIFLGVHGRKFNSTYAKKLSQNYKHIVIISGHYEGIDARVRKILKAEEVSIGPYILTGGEVPAMAIIDAVSRFIPGVLGNSTSLEEGRTVSADVYTRPEVFTYKGKRYRVPKVLLSGHHKEIEKWKNSLMRKKK